MFDSDECTGSSIYSGCFFRYVVSDVFAEVGSEDCGDRVDDDDTSQDGEGDNFAYLVYYSDNQCTDMTQRYGIFIFRCTGTQCTWILYPLTCLRFCKSIKQERAQVRCRLCLRPD